VRPGRQNHACMQSVQSSRFDEGGVTIRHKVRMVEKQEGNDRVSNLGPACLRRAGIGRLCRGGERREGRDSGRGVGVRLEKWKSIFDLDKKISRSY